MTPTKYTILLICEGDHTEPNFFEGLCEWLTETNEPGFRYFLEPSAPITINIADLMTDDEIMRIRIGKFQGIMIPYEE